MPYSELKPGRLRLEDETTGTAYLFIQKDDNLLWCDVSENILQVITNIKWGAKADRPTAGKKGLLYFATDTKEFFYDNGSDWVRVVSGETGLYDADRDTYIDVEPSSDADKIVGYTAGTQILNISSAGILTFPKQSGCYVYLSANQSITAGTETKINFDTVVYDVQNEYDTTNYRFTANEAGIYVITASIVFDVAASGNRLRGFLKVNGNYKLITGYTTADDYYHHITFGKVLRLNAGDYVEIFAKNGTADDTITSSSEYDTFLSIAKIA